MQGENAKEIREVLDLHNKERQAAMGLKTEGESLGMHDIWEEVV